MKGLLDVRLPEIGSRQSLRGSAPSCGRYERAFAVGTIFGEEENRRPEFEVEEA